MGIDFIEILLRGAAIFIVLFCLWLAWLDLSGRLDGIFDGKKNKKKKEKK